MYKNMYHNYLQVIIVRIIFYSCYEKYHKFSVQTRNGHSYIFLIFQILEHQEKLSITLRISSLTVFNELRNQLFTHYNSDCLPEKF